MASDGRETRELTRDICNKRQKLRKTAEISIQLLKLHKTSEIQKNADNCIGLQKTHEIIENT